MGVEEVRSQLFTRLRRTTNDENFGFQPGRKSVGCRDFQERSQNDDRGVARAVNENRILVSGGIRELKEPPITADSNGGAR
jgi:hypothetical protein